MESQRKIKQNSTQFQAYVRHECGALATRETRLTVDFCAAVSQSVLIQHFLFWNTVSTFCVQLVGDLEKARSSYRLISRAIPTNSACSMLVSDPPRRS